ncbi:MAG: glycosyltransferase family 4 protein [Opitutales bacterium]
MRLTFISPGTGSYFCGVCMRDNALVKALKQQGHAATLLPMYLPLLTDEPSMAEESPLFFGGINVYLQQHASVFRHTPRWMDSLLDRRSLLRSVAKRSNMHGGPELGPMTLSMLRGNEGMQNKEVGRLLDYLKAQPKPDAIFLSTVLQVGLARPLRQALGVPVFCSLQGEDFFLDSLGAEDRAEAYRLVAAQSPFVERFVAPSRYFAERMRRLAQLDTDKIAVLPNGISLEGYRPLNTFAKPRRIGFLAHMIPEKGLGHLVEAFAILKKMSGFEDVRLEIAGARRKHDEPFVSALEQHLREDGLEGQFAFSPNLSRAQKIDFLRGLSVFSVPTQIGEAFGLYLLEAWATGLPVVQPNRGSFPELIEATGGGVIYEPDTPQALAEALAELLNAPERAQQMGREASQAVFGRFSIESMAQSLVGFVDCGLQPAVSAT